MLLSFSEIPSFLITLVIFVWLVTITFLLIKVIKTFSKLTKGVSQKDLRALLEEILSEIKKEKEIDIDLVKKLELLKSEGLFSLQKTGLVRYNPFGDTGGNQSFVLAVLDGKDNGFVITSLHSREATRVFAKPVKIGKEDGFEFSKEEIQAVLIAQKRNPKI